MQLRFNTRVFAMEKGVTASGNALLQLLSHISPNRSVHHAYCVQIVPRSTEECDDLLS